MTKSRDIEERYGRACHISFCMGIVLCFSHLKDGRAPGTKSTPFRLEKVNRWIASNKAERWRVFDERLKAKGLA